MPAPTPVVILHRNRLFRDGLACAIERQAQVEVAAAAGDPRELRLRLDGRTPALIVLDLGLPQRQGLGDAHELRHTFPSTPIMMIGMSDLESDVVACCEAGASVCLPSDVSLHELVEHLRALAAGEVRCSPRVAALIVARLQQRARELQRLQLHGPVRLTRRELEIIALIDERLQNKEIAARLHIEVQTVKNHVHNILEKLELPGRHAVVRYARERGLLPSPGAGPLAAPNA